MNLMERSLRPVRLYAAPPGARDADAPAPAGAYEIIRAALSPCVESRALTPFGAQERRGATLLYDGARRLAPGMKITVNAGGSDEISYRVESVRRYPWLQAADLEAV